MDEVPETQTSELPSLTRDEDMWILRIESNGKVQEYRCGSELQARALAVLLQPRREEGPEDVPGTVS
jgi:hypothetical protein